MSLNFDFWVPPYDYHPPLIYEADLVHRHDSFVHCGFLLLLIPILHIHLKYQEKRSPGDMFWVPAGAHSSQLGGVVEEACQVSHMESELDNFQKIIMSNA